MLIKMKTNLIILFSLSQISCSQQQESTFLKILLVNTRSNELFHFTEFKYLLAEKPN
jgi:hypothetical protein